RPTHPSRWRRLACCGAAAPVTTLPRMSEAPRASTLPDLIRRQARRQPDRVAICDGDRTTTYGALDLRSNRVAQALYQAGLARQERVAFLDKDRDELFA